MSAAAVVAIVVAAGEAQAPATAALVAAAEEALGPSTSIRLFEASPPSDGAALRVEVTLHADAVATLAWEDATRLRAHARVHVARSGRWTDRTITFSPADTLPERARAVGFAVASMLPWAHLAPPAQAAHAAPPESEPPSPARAPRPPPATRVEPPPEMEPAPEREPVAESEPAESERAAPSGAGPRVPNAFGFAAVAGMQDLSMGGAVYAELFLMRSLSLRLGLAVRAGNAQSTVGDLVASAAAGLAWWPLSPSRTGRLGAGVRADLLVIRHQISYPVTVQTIGQTLLGAAFIAQITWRLRPGVEGVVGVGTELAFGNIQVFAGGDPNAPQLATIPALHVVGELGVRFRF